MNINEIIDCLGQNLEKPLIIVFRYDTEDECDFLMKKKSDLIAFYLSLQKKINYFSNRYFENTLIRNVLSSIYFDIKNMSYFNKSLIHLYNFDFNYFYDKLNFKEFEDKNICKKNKEYDVIFIEDLYMFSKKSMWPFVRNSLLLEINKEKETELSIKKEIKTKIDTLLLMNNLTLLTSQKKENSTNSNYNFINKHIIILQKKSNKHILNQTVSSASDVVFSIKKKGKILEFELEKSRIKFNKK
jgi:hypothetical protein